MSQSKFEAGEASQDIIAPQLKTPANYKPSIFRVPPIIRSTNLYAYEPQLVSIGPYHHGKCSLQAMQKVKWQILYHLLSQSPKDSIQNCIQKMLDLEADARRCYSEAIHMESHEFAEMLLLDGCFIMELIFSVNVGEVAPELKYLLDDNIFIQVRLLEDLLLIENQIPYFIFKHLIGVLNIPELKDFPFQGFMLLVFNTLLPHLQFSLSLEPKLEVAHLLHLLHESICIPWKKESVDASPSGPQSSQVSSLTERNQDSKARLLYFLHERISRILSSIRWKKKSNASPATDSEISKKSLFVVPSVTDLVEAGVKIRMRKADNFLNISFDKGVLHIPAIHVDDYTNLIFRNLIALEQFRTDIGMQITWYSSFMDCIINTERDVALLTRQRIIYNGLGSEMDIASMFNELCKGVTFFTGSNYRARLFEEVNAYYDSRWNRWRAKLMLDYLSNPWAIISLIAAAVLLVLTVVQTIFSVLSYTQQIHSIH